MKLLKERDMSGIHSIEVYSGEFRIDMNVWNKIRFLFGLSVQSKGLKSYNIKSGTIKELK